MNRALVTSSRFSPGNMAPEALESMFVGRAAMLDDALQRLKASATGTSKHFLLLVGPRGSGKTHFVALLHHRLRTAPEFAELRQQAHVAMLNEDEWGIASLLDLFVRILEVLAGLPGNESLRKSLPAVYKTHEHDPDRALRDAQGLLTEFVGPRTLLLICENLAEIFRGIGLEGQKQWRAFMHEHPFWSILATTARLFGGVQLRSSPFYGTFAVRYLDKLDFPTATSLLVRKARLDGRQDLAEFLDTATGRARARAIHHLAGGNPRVYIILSDFLTRQSLDDLVDPFLRMVDDLTPYYQDRIRQLAPRQRKIVEFLCRTGRPVVIKDLADRCLISQQTASKQLSELASLGMVERTAVGRNTYCELTEPLMRICIEVKDTRTEHLRLFVDFLRHWFSSRELRLGLESLDHERDARRRLDRMHLEVAVRECCEDRREPFLDALDAESRACLENDDFAGLAEIQCRLVEDRGTLTDYRQCAYALREAGRIEESIACARKGIECYPEDAQIHYLLARSLGEAGHPEAALQAVNSALRLKSGETMHLALRGDLLFVLRRFEELLQNEEDLLRIDPHDSLSLLNKSVALEKLGRVGEAEQAVRLLVAEHPDHALGWDGLARFLTFRGATEEALDAIERAISIDPEQPAYVVHNSWVLRFAGRCEESLAEAERACQIWPGEAECIVAKGDALRHLGRLEEALEEYDRAIVIDPRSSGALFGRAVCVHDIGRYEDALECCDRVLDVAPQHAHTFLAKASCLLMLTRQEEAVATCRKLVELSHEQGQVGPATVQHAASLLGIHRLYDVALELMDRAVALAPKDPELAIERCDLLIEVGRYGEAIEVISRAIEGGAADVGVRLKECIALAGLRGLPAGCERLEALLAEKPGEDLGENLPSVVARMLVAEVRRSGPVAMARQVHLVRKAIGGHSPGKVFSGAIAEILQSRVEPAELAGVEWQSAIPLLDSALEDLEDCGIALKMLSVAVRYSATADKSILLELPLEQRSLLTERFGSGNGGSANGDAAS